MAGISVREAAEILGCTDSHVRSLARSRKIKATRRQYPLERGRHYWEIDRKSVLEYGKREIRRGRPRVGSGRQKGRGKP